MSYRDPKQAIDNSIGIISQGITNFLSKTTKDIQTFAANRKAKEEAYKTSVNKKTYGAQEQLRKEFLASKQQLNEMRRRGDGTEDLKGMTKQAMDLLKKRYRDASDKIEEQMNASADTSLIQETIDDAIMWQKDFYVGMAKFSTSQQEYLKMLDNDGDVGGAVGSPEYQNNIAIWNYWSQIYDKDAGVKNVKTEVDDEGKVIKTATGTGEFNLVSDDNGTYISIGDPSDPTSVIDVNASNAIADKDGQYFQKNTLYNPEVEVKPITTALKDLLGTETSPTALRKTLLTDPDDPRSGISKDKVYKYLITDNKTQLKGALTMGAPNMWTSMTKGTNNEGTVYDETFFLKKIYDDGWNSWLKEKDKDFINN